jgi:hypothetical protein
MEETLVLVTTDAKGRLKEGNDHVYVDWGPEFALHSEMGLPDITPNISVNLGPLGLSYVLQVGGSGYFRMRAITPHVAAGRLHVVPGAPQFSYPIYSVQSAGADESIVGPALTGLRKVSTAGIPPGGSGAPSRRVRRTAARLRGR